MSPAVANFLFEAANLLLLTALLGWVLFKPVRRALDGERARHAQQQADLDRRRAETEAAAAELRAAGARAEQELQRNRQEVLAAARTQADAVLAEARREQSAERTRLEQELVAQRHGETAALAEVVGRVAAESVRSLLGAVQGPALEGALVRAARAGLAAIPIASRRPALVESAVPLDAESRRSLQELLPEGFEERVVVELGAGVRVTTPAGQIDATARSFARRAAAAIAERERAPRSTAEVEDG